MKTEKQTLIDLGMSAEEVDELEQDTNEYLESVYQSVDEENGE